MTPRVQGDTLVYHQDEQELMLTVGTAAWFAWLETASTFAFVSDAGSFTARHEQSGQKRGGWYWKAYRKQYGKLTSTYLGKSEELTLDRLNAAAKTLAHASVSESKAGPDGGLPPHAPPNTHGDALSILWSTRLHPPRPRAQLVPRSHLVDRLQQGVAGPLTLVSAPAGFGKTTLLAQWIAERSLPIAYLSLEPEDNDPVQFLFYMIGALQMVDTHLGATGLALLRAPASSTRNRNGPPQQ